MLKQYRTKPVIISAIEWTDKNADEIQAFLGDSGWIHETFSGCLTCVIYTLEGELDASWGDYIIKGLKGEFYPCKPDIFHMQYEEI